MYSGCSHLKLKKEILALFYDQKYHENANLEDIFK